MCCCPASVPSPLASSSCSYENIIFALEINSQQLEESSKERLYTDLASGSCTVPVQVEGYQSLCHSWEIPSVQVTETVTSHLPSWCLPTMHLNQLVTADLSVRFQKLVNIDKPTLPQLPNHNCPPPRLLCRNSEHECLQLNAINHKLNSSFKKSRFECSFIWFSLIFLHSTF